MDGTLSLFGFPSTPARLDVIPRSTSWRVSRAAAFMGGGLLLAPAVGLVPPHAPWIVGVLGIGGFLAIRKWRERYTIFSFEGPCPRCGGALTVSPGTPLRSIMTISCSGCQHDSRLRVTLPPASHKDESR